MARKKTSQSVNTVDLDSMGSASVDHSILLGQAFDRIIESNYGQMIAPKPIMTPTGITHLDALLGGGFVSSAPVQLTSTPETGKSTMAFQFSKTFLDSYENSVVVYLDVEGSGNVAKSTKFQISRVDTFGLDVARFKYEPVMVNVTNIFELITSLVTIKQRFEEKINKEFFLLLIWDSIAATPPSKITSVEDPNKIIGVKAREVTFCFDKYSPMLSFNRVSFMTIDQVRANIKIDGIYAPREQTVGEFKDFKAASAISAYNHRIAQWLFLSKGRSISPADGFGGLDGWELNILSEKNKYAPSKIMITCVFSKIHGIDKFWSELVFLSELIPTEKRIYKDKKFPFYLFLRKSGAWMQLKVKDPKTGKVDYSSEKFYKKNAKTMYLHDSAFKKWFDYAVNLSVYQRITNGLFQLDLDEPTTIEDEPMQIEESIESTLVDSMLDDTTDNIEQQSEVEFETTPSIQIDEQEIVQNAESQEQVEFETTPIVQTTEEETEQIIVVEDKMVVADEFVTNQNVEQQPEEKIEQVSETESEKDSGYKSIF